METPSHEVILEKVVIDFRYSDDLKKILNLLVALEINWK